MGSTQAHVWSSGQLGIYNTLLAHTQWAFSSELSKISCDCANNFHKTRPAMIHWLLSQFVWKPRELVGSLCCFLLFYWACQNDQHLHMLMSLGGCSIFRYVLIKLPALKSICLDPFVGQLMLLVSVVLCSQLCLLICAICQKKKKLNRCGGKLSHWPRNKWFIFGASYPNITR